MGNVPKLGIEGENLEGVWDALDFIERAKLGLPIPDLGERVAIVGAGNTAIDALTCAKRLSISRGKDARVVCYYRRGEEQMTAYQFEYDFAKEEGIEFRFFCAPKRIIGQNLHVNAVEFVRTRLETQGDREVVAPIAGSEFTEPVDTFIRAIGQSRLIETFDRLGIAHDFGVVKVDDSLQTSRPGVWAAGDCIFEKGMREAMVVEVAEQGKVAARGIDAFLNAKVPA
jgi:dihydropyrimidine dehydrogenase (NAD+) subunit PreT